MEDELLSALTILKESRKKLVYRTISETPDLFKYFFEFEDNFDVLSLVYERERIIFIDDNMYGQQGHYNNIINNNILRDAVIYLINKIDDSEHQYDALYKNEFVKLYNTKLHFVENILSIERDSSITLNKIKYQKSKDNALFERLLNNMMREK